MHNLFIFKNICVWLKISFNILKLVTLIFPVETTLLFIPVSIDIDIVLVFNIGMSLLPSPIEHIFIHFDSKG